MEKLKSALEKMHYELVGKHSAIQVCMWTKESLLDKDVCYKNQFYPELVKSHRCVQMTPCLDCDQRCVFCWRPWEISFKKNSEWDDAKTIIDGCIAAFRKKISGFGGNEKINMHKFEEAQNPYSFAISLMAEPTLYPYLNDLIKELRNRNIVSFLVTNGQHPEVLEKLAKEDALPTQLYISLDAPNKELYEKINQPLNIDGLARLNKTLKLLPDLKCRRVLRLTIIKGLNDCLIREWAKLIEPTCVDFLEIKSYMHLGYSRKRLKLSNMLTYEEIMNFAEKLAKELDYKLKDSNKRSRVVLLSK